MRLFRQRKRILVRGDSAVYHVMSRTACQAFLFEDEEKEVFCRMLRKQAAFAGGPGVGLLCDGQSSSFAAAGASRGYLV